MPAPYEAPYQWWLLGSPSSLWKHREVVTVTRICKAFCSVPSGVWAARQGPGTPTPLAGSRLLLCSHKWRKFLVGPGPALAFGLGVCSWVKCVWLSFLGALNHPGQPSLLGDNPHVRRPDFWAPEASSGDAPGKGRPGPQADEPGCLWTPRNRAAAMPRWGDARERLRPRLTGGDSCHSSS